MNKQVPAIVSINRAKISLAKAVNQIAQESNLPPSLFVCVLDNVRAQYMENVIREMQVLYEDTVIQSEGEK